MTTTLTVPARAARAHHVPASTTPTTTIPTRTVLTGAPQRARHGWSDRTLASALGTAAVGLALWIPALAAGMQASVTSAGWLAWVALDLGELVCLTGAAVGLAQPAWLDAEHRRGRASHVCAVGAGTLLLLDAVVDVATSWSTPAGLLTAGAMAALVELPLAAAALVAAGRLAARRPRTLALTA